MLLYRHWCRLMHVFNFLDNMPNVIIYVQLLKKLNPMPARASVVETGALPIGTGAVAAAHRAAGPQRASQRARLAAVAGGAGRAVGA